MMNCVWAEFAQRRGHRRLDARRHGRFERFQQRHHRGVAHLAERFNRVLLQRPVLFRRFDECRHRALRPVVAERLHHAGSKEIDAPLDERHERRGDARLVPRRGDGPRERRPDELGLFGRERSHQRGRDVGLRVVFEPGVRDRPEPIVLVGQDLAHRLVRRVEAEAAEQDQRLIADVAVGAAARRVDQRGNRRDCRQASNRLRRGRPRFEVERPQLADERRQRRRSLLSIGGGQSNRQADRRDRGHAGAAGDHSLSFRASCR
jgi:hypothetical protein